MWGGLEPPTCLMEDSRRQSCSLLTHSEAQLWSWCLALIPSCGVGETKSYFWYDSLVFVFLCFVFFFFKSHWQVCFGFVHQYSTKEIKNFRVGCSSLPPSLVMLLNHSPFRTTPANLHRRKRMPSSKQTTSWSSNDRQSMFKPLVLLIQSFFCAWFNPKQL